jgi:hypothetical protein
MSHAHRPLPSRRTFARHLLRNATLSGSLLAFGLGIGIVGYHAWGGLPWLDALLNAAMILGGEGPVSPMRTAAGKWFASFYALFGGVVFITASSVFLAPLAHRFLHRFHLDLDAPGEP